MPEICPFCQRDPFEYVDVGVGVGMVPVAVTCCELGDDFFRGARSPIEHDVRIMPDEFMEIGGRLLSMRAELEAYRQKYGPIWTDHEEKD